MKNWLIFLAGAVCGAVPAYLFAKKKYEQIANEAIADVKDAYKRRREQDLLADKDRNKPSLKEVADISLNRREEQEENQKEAETILQEEGYSKEEALWRMDRMSPQERAYATPYIITPEEFGEKYGASNILILTYYKGNDILVDDANGVPEDIESMIGFDALDHFGDYARDQVHVRNDRYMVDIDVSLDRGSYEPEGDA